MFVALRLSHSDSLMMITLCHDHRTSWFVLLLLHFSSFFSSLLSPSLTIIQSGKFLSLPCKWESNEACFQLLLLLVSHLLNTNACEGYFNCWSIECLVDGGHFFIFAGFFGCSPLIDSPDICYSWMLKCLIYSYS